MLKLSVNQNLKSKFWPQHWLALSKHLWEQTDPKIRNKAPISCLDRLDGIEASPFPFVDGPSDRWSGKMEWNHHVSHEDALGQWSMVVLQRSTCETENKQREKVVVWKIVDWRNYRDRRLFISKLLETSPCEPQFECANSKRCLRLSTRLLKDIKACLWSQTQKTKGRCLRSTLNIHFLFSKQRKLKLVSDKNLVENVNVSLSCLHEAIKV